VDAEIKRRVIEKIKAKRFKKIPIVVAGKDDKGLEGKTNQTLCITFRIGQQKIQLDNKDIMLGAVATTINTCDKFINSEHNSLENRIAPEPFIYDPEVGDRASFERAIDFAVFRLTNYLNYLGSVYQ
jgi:hypothetical protein